MKLISALKEIWQSYDFIFIRLTIMFFAFRWFTVEDFDLIEELGISFGFLVISCIVFIIADVLSFRSGQTLFLSVPDNIKKTIAQDLFCYRILSEQRGLFRSMPIVIDNVLQYEHTPISNPEEFYYKAYAYINVLNNFHTADAQRMVDKIYALQDEATYMIQNTDVIPVIIKNAQ